MNQFSLELFLIINFFNLIGHLNYNYFQIEKYIT